MTPGDFDKDYEFLAPGPRAVLRKAIDQGDDRVIDQSGLSDQQIGLLKVIAARHRKGLKTTVKDIWK